MSIEAKEMENCDIVKLKMGKATVFLAKHLIPEILNELAMLPVMKTVSGASPLIVYVSSDEDRKDLIEVLQSTNAIKRVVS